MEVSDDVNNIYSNLLLHPFFGLFGNFWIAVNALEHRANRVAIALGAHPGVNGIRRIRFGQ